jgi:hypothetical protein
MHWVLYATIRVRSGHESSRPLEKPKHVANPDIHFNIIYVLCLTNFSLVYYWRKYAELCYCLCTLRWVLKSRPTFYSIRSCGNPCSTLYATDLQQLALILFRKAPPPTAHSIQNLNPRWVFFNLFLNSSRQVPHKCLLFKTTQLKLLHYIQRKQHI